MDWNRLPKYSQKKEEKLTKEIQEEKLSFKDRFAMLFAAYIVFLPPVLLFCGIILLIVLLIQ